jgi:hypothetical protein
MKKYNITIWLNFEHPCANYLAQGFFNANTCINTSFEKMPMDANNIAPILNK